MTKKERIRILIGIGVMAVVFLAMAAIGWMHQSWREDKQKRALSVMLFFDEKI